MEIADLIADPLPAVDGAALLALAPDAAAWASREAGRSSSKDIDSRGAEAIWLCQAALAKAKPAERAVERLAGCLQAIDWYWREYLQSTPSGQSLAAFNIARSVYAYASSQEFEGGRSRLDSILTTSLPSSDSPSASISPTGLRPAGDLLAARDKTSQAELFDALAAASVEDPRGELPVVDVFHFPSATTSVDSCVYGLPGEPVEERAPACLVLTLRLWQKYIATGSAAAFVAAVKAFEYGYWVAIPGCESSTGACRANYPEMMAEYLSRLS